MADEVKKALDAVMEINGEIHDFLIERWQGDKVFAIDLCDPVLDLETDGDSVIVKLFQGFVIWSSNDDGRHFCEETDEYEPIEGFLRKKAQKLITEIGTLKFLTKGGESDD